MYTCTCAVYTGGIPSSQPAGKQTTEEADIFSGEQNRDQVYIYIHVYTYNYVHTVYMYSDPEAVTVRRMLCVCPLPAGRVR